MSEPIFGKVTIALYGAKLSKKSIVSIPEGGNEKNVSGLKISNVSFGCDEFWERIDDVGVVDVDDFGLVALQVKVEGIVRRPHYCTFVPDHLEGRKM